METMQLDTMRAHIISMIYEETNEKMLNDIELLLLENKIPPMGNYSAENYKVIYYIDNETTIYVVAVFDCRQNPEKLKKDIEKFNG